jgi:hypothetical protein
MCEVEMDDGRYDVSCVLGRMGCSRCWSLVRHVWQCTWAFRPLPCVRAGGSVAGLAVQCRSDRLGFVKEKHPSPQEPEPRREARRFSAPCCASLAPYTTNHVAHQAAERRTHTSSGSFLSLQVLVSFVNCLHVGYLGQLAD